METKLEKLLSDIQTAYDKYKAADEDYGASWKEAHNAREKYEKLAYLSSDKRVKCEWLRRDLDNLKDRLFDLVCVTPIPDLVPLEGFSPKIITNETIE